MTAGEPGLSRQLRRQSLWLKDSWLWLLRTKVLTDTGPTAARPTGLDVGCGPGFVMEELAGLMEVRGVDVDRDMVQACTVRGLDVVEGDAAHLPFDDISFDVVYCSFLMMWLKDPSAALKEMKRVSRGWVVCLAEPDYGARIDYPEAIAGLTRLVSEGIRAEGGDPTVGRKLRGAFHACGMEAEIGVHSGVWDIGRLRQETEDEWRWIRTTAGSNTDERGLVESRAAWDRALEDGSLFQYNPMFYAIARV